jgi:hypothetical protein
MLYKELENVENIEDVIPPNNCLIILYPGFKETSGHWTVLFIENNTIFFFDPFGNLPDEACEYNQNDWDPEQYRRLSYLLAKSPLPVDFNNYQLQSLPETTCGYWCIARVKMRKYSTDDFFQFWKVKPNQSLPDDLVKYYVENY